MPALRKLFHPQDTDWMVLLIVQETVFGTCQGVTADKGNPMIKGRKIKRKLLKKTPAGVVVVKEEELNMVQQAIKDAHAAIKRAYRWCIK